MKLIIDIPDEEYKTLSELSEKEKVNELSCYERVIADGTPYEERTQGDLISRDALKAYARKVICGGNPTNTLIIRMFDEIIDNAPSEVEKDN